jgi:hypothetical protein
MGLGDWFERRKEPRWRTSLRAFTIGGASGLLAGLYLAARGRDSTAIRLKRQLDLERLARERAERRAGEAEHLALHALEREHELAERLHAAELRLRDGGGAPPDDQR